MSHREKKATPRVAEEIMTGMRELQRMMDEHKSPEELFTIRTIEIPEPNVYRSRQVRALRLSLGVSQAVFASLLGVSVVLVKSWERGVREPSPMARRLLDTIKANPSKWLAAVRHMAAAQDCQYAKRFIDYALHRADTGAELRQYIETLVRGTPAPVAPPQESHRKRLK